MSTRVQLLALYQHAKTHGTFHKEILPELRSVDKDTLQDEIQAVFNELGFSSDLEDRTDDRTMFGWVMATALGMSWNPKANRYQTRDDRLDYL